MGFAIGCGVFALVCLIFAFFCGGGVEKLKAAFNRDKSSSGEKRPVKINGIEIYKCESIALIKYQKTYSILIPFYVLFAAFFAIVGVKFLFDPEGMDEMRIVGIIGIIGTIIFMIVAINMLIKVIAMKKEIMSRNVPAEEKSAANRAFARGFVKVVIITVVCCLIMAVIIWGVTSKDKGYWGSDGYYNPSKSELADARDKADRWMSENW